MLGDPKIIDLIDEHIAKFRGKVVSVEIANKVTKRGIVVNWKINPYYFELIINTERKDGDVVKLFYPFGFEFHGDDFEPEVFLDYRLSVLNKKEKFNFSLDDVKIIKTHKHLNKIVKITSE